MKRTANVLFLLLLAGSILLGALLTVSHALLRPDAASYYENRFLDTLSPWSGEGLWTGEDFAALDGVLADHFPGRNALIRLDTRVDLALGRASIHGVALGDGALFPDHGHLRWDFSYQSALAGEMTDSLAALRDQIEGYGGHLLYVSIPQQFSYFRDRYPADMDDRQWYLQPARAVFADAMAARELDFLDGEALYDALGRPAQFYYLSDHHYTYRGMLPLYRAALERLNETAGLDLAILSDDDLILTDLPNPFLGSENRKLYGCWPSDEAVTIAGIPDAPAFRRWDNGVEVAPTLYDLPDGEDEVVGYGLYMGGDVAETVIRTDRPQLPTCLIWGDSFTNAMETLLWQSFDETRSLDLRYYTQCSLSDYIAQYQPDVVICLRDETGYLDTTGNGALF